MRGWGGEVARAHLQLATAALKEGLEKGLPAVSQGDLQLRLGELEGALPWQQECCLLVSEDKVAHEYELLECLHGPAAHWMSGNPVIQKNTLIHTVSALARNVRLARSCTFTASVHSCIPGHALVQSPRNMLVHAFGSTNKSMGHYLHTTVVFGPKLPGPPAKHQCLF